MEVLNLNNEMGKPIPREPRDFAFVRFYCPILRREMIDWNYTDSQGRIFTGMAADLALAHNQAELAANEQILATPPFD